MKMKAYRLAQVDKDFEMHKQAWLNHLVTQTKEQNKKQVPKFKHFKDFYDYEKALKETEQEEKEPLSPLQKRLAKIALEVNKKGG